MNNYPQVQTEMHVMNHTDWSCFKIDNPEIQFLTEMHVMNNYPQVQTEMHGTVPSGNVMNNDPQVQQRAWIVPRRNNDQFLTTSIKWRRKSDLYVALLIPQFNATDDIRLVNNRSQFDEEILQARGWVVLFEILVISPNSIATIPLIEGDLIEGELKKKIKYHDQSATFRLMFKCTKCKSDFVTGVPRNRRTASEVQTVLRATLYHSQEIVEYETEILWSPKPAPRSI